MKKDIIQNDSCSCGRVKIHARGMCSSCYNKQRRKERLDLSDFKKCINHPDRNHNARGMCSECYAKWRRENHPEQIKKEHLKNREKYLNRAKNFSKSKEGIEYRKKNYDRRMKEDINYKLLTVLRSRLYGTITKKYKNNTTVELLGCSVEEARDYLESKFAEGMNWENQGLRGWHIDHIRPCSSFDLTDPEQQKICFHYTNLQPLWAEENWRKGDKYDS